MANYCFSDVKWMPCLGRNFRLGDLYDCCTDKIVIGSSIWDEKAIHEAKIEIPNKTTANKCTKCVPHNNIQRKVSYLEINEELYLSCAAGHIKFDGEAKFYNDEVVSKYVIRVALKYYSYSKITQLKKCIVKSESINTFEQEGATDVITGIKYGAISIIVCYQKVQETHDIEAVYGNLQAKIDYLQSCISGNYNELFSSMETNSENITCRIFSTLDLPQKETINSYKDTVVLCKDLSKLHADESTQVPIEVSLYPLKKINKIFTKCARNINEIKLITDIQEMHDIMNNMRLDLMDLRVMAHNTLPCITDKVECYNTSIMNLQSEFSKILHCLVPDYRKGHIEESTLKQEINTFFEKLKLLNTLVQNKLKETQQIRVFMKAIADYELITISSSVHFEYNYVICLEFNTIHLIDFELPPNKPWYLDKEVVAKTRHKIKEFLKFAKVNGNKEGTKFGVGEFSNQTCKELVVINVYFDENVLLFEPPTMPGKPVESQVTDSTITLTWSEPQQGAQFIFFYYIYFRKTDDADKWNLYTTENHENNYTKIENLEANTGYIFKVCATLIIPCITIESKVSETIYTTKSADVKTSKSNIATKIDSPSSDSQGMTSTNKGNATDNYSKEVATELNETENTGQSESKIASKEKENHCLQDPARKFLGKGMHAQKPIKNIAPKNSTIKAFHQANKCDQLNTGNPRLYKLHVTKEPIKLTDVEIFTFGDKHNLPLPEKVILLVGATGAGKTTLVNGIANYIFGVEWKDPERVVLTEHSNDKEGLSQAESQTKSVEVYKIYHSKHDQLLYNLTIIDTPGFGDTEGVKKDQRIVEKIGALLTSDKVIDHIDGIGFVVQAPFNRLTPTQSYIIHSVYSLFGNDVANNIFVLATFTDKLSSPPILDALAEAKIQYNKIFKFNNSALYANTNKTDNEGLLNKSLWEVGMKSLSTFFNELKNVNPVSLTLTKEVLSERKTLQDLAEGIQQKINCEFMNMQKLEHEEQALNSYKNEAEKNENFQYQEYVLSHELVPLSSQGHIATCCHKCKITCHAYCLEYYKYGQCSMMINIQSSKFKGYICKVCKCCMSEHATSQNFYHTFFGVETKTIKDMKQKYDEAQSAQINIEKVIAKIAGELEKVRKIVRKKLLEMHKCIRRINEISLQSIMITEVDYISTLVASENTEQTEGYISRVKFYQEVLKELQRSNKVPGIETNSSEV